MTKLRFRTFVNAFIQLAARFENRKPFLRDVHQFASSGISPLVRLILLDLEASEATNLNPPTIS